MTGLVAIGGSPQCRDVGSATGRHKNTVSGRQGRVERQHARLFASDREGQNSFQSRRPWGASAMDASRHELILSYDFHRTGVRLQNYMTLTTTICDVNTAN